MTPLFILLLLGVWYPSGTGYDYAPIYLQEDISDLCMHDHARACVWEVNGVMSIITKPHDLHGFESKGCTILTHEYYHLLNYRESEIPKCSYTTEFRK
jgi:hypothetical protein